VRFSAARSTAIEIERTIFAGSTMLYSDHTTASRNRRRSKSSTRAQAFAGLSGERSGYTDQVKRTLAVLAILLVGVPLLAGCVIASTSSDDGNGGGFFLLLWPVLIVAAVALIAGVGRRRRRARSHDVAAVGPSSHMLRAELSVVADDVLRLEPRVALREEAREDFDAATHRYRVAHAALDASDAPVDVARVQRVVDEATWLMARARAVLDDRRPPEPPPSLQNRGARGEPAIELDEHEHPVYVGSEAPFRTGWFAAGGGLFGGLLLGTMLGGFGGWVDDGGYGLDSDGGPEGPPTDW
jgi:hypothetical protein